MAGGFYITVNSDLLQRFDAGLAKLPLELRRKAAIAVLMRAARIQLKAWRQLIPVGSDEPHLRDLLQPHPSRPSGDYDSVGVYSTAAPYAHLIDLGHALVMFGKAVDKRTRALQTRDIAASLTKDAQDTAIRVGLDQTITRLLTELVGAS